MGHIAKFAQAGFPFTPVETRSIAFEFAKLNSIQGFSPKSLGKLAGRKWLRGFLSRHDDLSISTPKLLSVYRANCANPTLINKWFELYQEVLDNNGIKSPLRIWNEDECGCIDSPKPKKVVTLKRKNSIQLSSADKGETATVVTFINAAGMHLRPIVIHKGQKVMEI